MAVNMLADLPQTFVYFSTGPNGDFIVGLRQWRSVSQQTFDDIQLNSLQFANLLFQMKALERQFMVEEAADLSSTNWNQFMSSISDPLATSHDDVASTDNPGGSVNSPIIIESGNGTLPPATPVRPKANSTKRKKKKPVETIIIDDAPIVDLTGEDAPIVDLTSL